MLGCMEQNGSSHFFVNLRSSFDFTKDEIATA